MDLELLQEIFGIRMMKVFLLGELMPETIPLTTTEEVQDFITENQLKETLQRMLDHIPSQIPLLRGIHVFLQEPYDLGGGPCVIIDVQRDRLTAEYDEVEWNWRMWVSENFTPEESQHFCLLTNYGFGPTHAR